MSEEKKPVFHAVKPLPTTRLTKPQSEERDAEDAHKYRLQQAEELLKSLGYTLKEGVFVKEEQP